MSNKIPRTMREKWNRTQKEKKTEWKEHKTRIETTYKGLIRRYSGFLTQPFLQFEADWPF